MPDVIAQVTLVVGEGEYAPPGTPVTIEDPEEAKKLVDAGDALWPGDEPPEEFRGGEVESGADREAGSGDADEMDRSELPEDLPGREALIEAEITTLDQVRAVQDFDEIPGIGQKTEAKLIAYLEELEA